MHLKSLLSCIATVLNVLSLTGCHDDFRATSLRTSGSESATEIPILQSESIIHGQWIASDSNLTIYISEAGTDSPDCVHRNKVVPCRSIQHAFTETMIQITNATRQIKFVFMDERYGMTEPLIVDREAVFVKSIEFTSTVRTTVIGMSDEAVIWIGCNTTATIPCISYDVKFSNLNFSGFGSKLPAVLVGFDINHLFLYDCSFHCNNRSAINLLDTSVVLNNVDFSDNKGNYNFMDIGAKVSGGFPSTNISNGGAVAFVFRDGQGKFVNISSCNFTRNNAAEILLPSPPYTSSLAKFLVFYNDFFKTNSESQYVDRSIVKHQDKVWAKRVTSYQR